MLLIQGAHLPLRATKTSDLRLSMRWGFPKWESSQEIPKTGPTNKIPSKSETVMPCSKLMEKPFSQLWLLVWAPHTSKPLSLTRIRQITWAQAQQRDASSQTLQANMGVKGMLCKTFRASTLWATSRVSSSWIPMHLTATSYPTVSKRTHNLPRWVLQSGLLRLWKAAQCLLLLRSNSRTWKSSQAVLKSSRAAESTPSWLTKMEVLESFLTDFSSKVLDKVLTCIEELVSITNNRWTRIKSQFTAYIYF